jgi:hypothetical protein
MLFLSIYCVLLLLEIASLQFCRELLYFILFFGSKLVSSNSGVILLSVRVLEVNSTRIHLFLFIHEENSYIYIYIFVL